MRAVGRFLQDQRAKEALESVAADPDADWKLRTTAQSELAQRGVSEY